MGKRQRKEHQLSRYAPLREVLYQRFSFRSFFLLLLLSFHILFIISFLCYTPWNVHKMYCTIPLDNFYLS